MEKEPRRTEQSERNLLTDPMATIEAMAQVEGPEWLQQQESMKEGVTDESTWEFGLQRALANLKEGRRSVVYGNGGVNRWKVKSDGTVIFMLLHGQGEDKGNTNYPTETLKRVEALGFAIVP